jgi:hypothetical protein
MPNGDDLKFIEIDAASDVRWSKTFDLTNKSETYSGKWKLNINTERAEGSYRLQISTW